VPGIEPGTSGSVARNSDHETTETVFGSIEFHNSVLFVGRMIKARKIRWISALERK
jgi:hypothetical protein